MKTRIDDKDFIKALQEEFAHKELIRTQELKMYLENIYPEYNSNSIYWIISDLNKRRIIDRVSRGFYKIPNTSNSNNIGVVLLGDIKASREMYINDSMFEHRILEKVKSDFQKIDSKLEVTYSKETVFDIVFGDEINYYSELNSLFMKKLLLILYHVRPAFLRFVLSVGDVSNHELVEFSKMNSEVFWNARDIFTSPEFKNNKEQKYNAIIWPESNVLQNSLLELILDVISGWTDKQWDVIYYKILGYTNENIGKNFNISHQAVADRLASAKYKLISKSVDELVKLMRGGKKW